MCLLKYREPNKECGKFFSYLDTYGYCVTSARALLDWINITNKNSSDHHLPLTLTITKTHKHTHTQIPMVTYWSISHWQSPWPQMLNVWHAGKKPTALYCRMVSFKASLTLELVSYSSGGDTMSDTGSGLLTLFSQLQGNQVATLSTMIISGRESVMIQTSHKMTLWDTTCLFVVVTEHLVSSNIKISNFL